MKKSFIILAGLVLALGLAGCTPQTSSSASSEEPPISESSSEASSDSIPPSSLESSSEIPSESSSEIIPELVFGLPEPEVGHYMRDADVIELANGERYLVYTTNKDKGEEDDVIAIRHAVFVEESGHSYGEEHIIVTPSEEGWDKFISAPTITKGAFKYEGSDYANPIANYYTSPEYVDDFATWGYGQPSLISVDKAGEILLFYSKGLATGTFQAVEHWDLSNLNSPVKIKAANVSNAGVVNANGGSDVINNADFAYDSFNKRIYVIKEDFPYTATVDPKWITTANTILYIDLLAETSVGDSLFLTQPLRWQRVGSVGPNETGMERVHNAGLLTDEYGWLLNPYQIPVVYTKSDLSSSYPDWELRGQWPALHTYRLHGYLLEL